MEINKQPREGFDTQGTVEVFKAWLTIQGEGPQIGTPSVFVRLSGCNLQCPLCDTDYTSIRRAMTPDEVVTMVQGIRPSGLVVFTGGEPVRQNIGPVIRALLDAEYSVQIETNGVLWREDIPWREIITVCSPKTPKIHPQLEPHIDALKYVLAANEMDPTDGLPSSALGLHRPARPTPALSRARIYIQPLDEQDPEKNKNHVQAALDSCYEFDYILCLQTHKFIGLE
jgi:7-carboxy-7-deazaguanine synthase